MRPSAVSEAAQPTSSETVELAGSAEQGAKESGADTATKSSRHVSIIVDFGDGREISVMKVAWREHMTVIDALNATADTPGMKTVECRGSGETAFLVAINGIRNTGAGKNWIFKVNGERSQVGAGSFLLNPGDRVLWGFTAGW